MKRGLLDLIIACVSLSVFILAFFYMQKELWLLVVTGISFFVFLALGIINRDKPLYFKNVDAMGNAAIGPRQLVLLSEEDTELTSWDLFDRTSLIIGRDIGENQVDINLADATFGSFIDIEHAVLNFAGEQWYIEDLHSQNGVRVEKKGDRQQYRLASDKPCKVEIGDVIYIAQTKLLVR